MPFISFHHNCTDSSRCKCCVSTYPSLSSLKHKEQEYNMSSNNGGGWLTTKKRGRDDAEIEKAKTAAKEQRKQRNGRSNAAAKAKGGGASKKKKPAPKKKKQKDEYEEDDFLVEEDDSEEEEEEVEFDGDDDDSDEELSEAVYSEDDDEEDSLIVAATNKNRATAATASQRRRRDGAAVAASSLALQKRVTCSSNDDDSKSSDDEDDDFLEEPPATAVATAAARGKKNNNNNDSSSDDDSEEGDSFLPDYPHHHTSRLAPHMMNRTRQRPTAAAKRASNNRNRKNQSHQRSVLEETTTTATAAKQAAPQNKKEPPKHEKESLGDGSSSDESHVDILKKKKVTTPTILLIESSSSSSDDDDGDDLDSSKKRKATAAVKTSKANNNNTAAVVDLTSPLDDDDDDNDGRNKPRRTLKKLGQKKPIVVTKVATTAAAAAADTTTVKETKSNFFDDKKKNSVLHDDDNDVSSSYEDGETPVGNRKTNGKTRRRVAVAHHDDEDDEDEQAEFQTTPTGTGMESDMDEDEQITLALALSESEAAATAKEKKKIVNDDLQDSDEDDNDNDGDGDEGQDAFFDEDDDPDAKTADMVLSTANQLSAQILQTMTQWIVGNCKNDDNDDKNADAPKLPLGMIVDGALAMADMGSSGGGGGGNGGDDDSSNWISRETMQEICPDVTLANYQLIGVNWMALLHGMKVQVGSSPDEVNDVSSNSKKKKKKYINVNGILADEMGLGKTVQTICFLAWLKHTHHQVQQGKRASITNDCNDDDDDEILDSDNDDIVTQHERKPNGRNGNTAPRPPLTLVVAPASVLSNWEREFENFAPHMKVIKYHGSIAEREEIKEDLRQRLLLPGRRGGRHASFVKRKKDSDLDTSDKDEGKGGDDEDNGAQEHDDPMSVDVILAPVTYFQQERSDDRVFLRKLRYEYLVVDEAHLLKNARGLRYKNLDRFKTAHRLLLTGTPVQNSPAELICLLSFATRLFSRTGGAQRFDDDNENDGGESMLKHFVEAHRVNIGKGSSNSGDDDGYAAAYRKLKQLFSPFVLRRRKVDVLSQIMPPKERTVEFVTLDEASRSVYDCILYNHINGKKKRGTESNAGKDHVFTQLRKAAHHPLLLRTRYTSATEKEHLNRCFHAYGAFKGAAATLPKVSEELEKFNDFDIHVTAMDLIAENPCRQSELERYVLKEDDLFSSPKFVRLRALLPQLVADGHRVLIFSVWTQCLDLLTCLMDSMNMQYLRMQGDTVVQERQGLIDMFNNDPTIPVFLLSTTACGLGINLTAADTCIMHDISFNPFNDLQAEDRCHRIGQKRPVTVIKLVTQDTVDNDIYEMQERKAKMNAAIMENNNSNNNSTEKWNDKQAQQHVLQNAVDRYLKSPPPSQKETMDNSGNNNNNTTRDIKEKKQDSSGVMDAGDLFKENKNNMVVLSDSTEV